MKTIPGLVVFVCLFSLCYGQQAFNLEHIKQLVNRQHYEQARTLLEQQLEKNEDAPEINYWLGLIALRKNEYNDAIDYLDDAVDADASNSRYYLMLGNAYGLKARDGGMLVAAFAAPKAKSNWEKALELQPDYLQAQQSLFQYYLQAPGIVGGGDDKAKKMALEIMENYPVLGRVFLANYYLSAEDDAQKAGQELEIAMHADSSTFKSNYVKSAKLRLLNSLGYYYLQNDQAAQSRKYFRMAVDLAPERPNPNVSMGDYYVKTAAYDSALIFYEQAVACDSLFGPSLLNRADMLVKLGRIEEAKAAYREIITAHKNDDYGDTAADKLEELN